MADRYWVGGTGTWNTTSTTNWSATSGGASGASVPTTADNVIFDQAGTYTVTMIGALACLNITVSAGVVTLNGFNINGLTVAGSWSTIAGTVWSQAANMIVTFTSTTARTITSGGVQFPGRFDFNGAGGTWTLQDNIFVVTLVNHIAGTLELGSFTLTTREFSSSGSGVRTINFGTGNITLDNNSGSSTTIWNTSTNTNLTISGTPLVITKCSGAISTTTMTVSTGALSEANSISFQLNDTTGFGKIQFSVGSVVRNLTLNGNMPLSTPFGITIYGNYTYTSGTITATAYAWTFAGTSGTKTISTGATTHDLPFTLDGAGSTFLLDTNLTLGATRVLTLTNGTFDQNAKTITSANTTVVTGSVTVNNLNIGSFVHTSGTLTLGTDAIVFSTSFSAGTLQLGSFTLTTRTFSSSGSGVRTLNFGTGKIVLNSSTSETIWNTSTNTNLTISGTPLVECKGGGTGVIKTINTGALSEANSISFSLLETTGTVTYTFTAGNRVRNLVINGVQTISNIAITIFGALTHTTTNGTTTFTAGANAWTFGATSGSYNITPATVFQFPLIFNGIGGTWVLQSNLTTASTRSITFSNGTVDFNNQRITSGTGQISVNNGTSVTILNASDDLGSYINHSAGTLVLGSNCAFQRYILSSGTLNLNNFSLSCTTGTSLETNFDASGSLTRTINFGTSGNIRVIRNAGTNGVVCNINNTAGLTISGTPLVIVEGSGAITRTLDIASGFTQTNAISFQLNATGGTVTFTSLARVRNLTVNGTFTFTVGALFIFGSYTYVSGTLTSSTASEGWNFVATSGSHTIDFGGVTHDTIVNFGVNAVSTAVYTYNSNITIGATKAVRYDSGTWDFNNKNFSTGASVTFQNQSMTFRNTGGTSINFPLSITHGSQVAGASVTLEANLTTTGTYSLTGNPCRLNLGSSVLTAQIFSSSVGNARTLDFGTGRIDLTGNNGTIWDTGTIGSMTYAGTVYIRSTYTGAVGTRTFNTGAMSEAVAAGFNVVTSGSSGVVIGASSDTVALTGAFNNFDLTGFTGSLSNTLRTIYGNFTIPASGGTFTSGTNATTFSGAGTELITTNGRTLGFPITVNGTGTTRLADALTLSSTLTTTLTAGTLDLNGFTLTTGAFFSSGTTARTLAFGTGQLALALNGATIFDVTTTTNFSTTGTVYINSTYTGATGTRTFVTGFTEAQAAGYDVKTSGSTGIVIGASSDIVAFTGNFNNFDLTGFTGTLSNTTRTLYGNFTIPASGGTLTAGTNATTFSGAGTELITTNGRSLGFPITINGTGTTSLAGALTLTGTLTATLQAGTLDLNGFTLTSPFFDSSFTTSRTIAFNGGQIAISGNGGNPQLNIQTATNFFWTGTPYFNLTYTGATGTRVISLGSTTQGTFGLGNAFDISVNGTSGIRLGTGTDIIAVQGFMNNLDLTGMTFTFANRTRTIFGNITIPATGGSYESGSFVNTMVNNSSKTIDTNGRSTFSNFTLGTTDITTGTYVLLNDLVVGPGTQGAFTLVSGTLDLNDKNVTALSMSLSSTSTKSINFRTSSVMTLNATINAVWDASTNGGTNFSWSGTARIFADYTGSFSTRRLVFGQTPEQSTFDIKFASTVQANCFTIRTSTDGMDIQGNVKSLDYTGTTNIIRGPDVILGRTVFGDYIIPSTGGSFDLSGTPVTFAGSSGTNTITTNGRTHTGPININCAGKTIKQIGATTLSTTNGGILTVTAGTLDLNNLTFTASRFNSTGTGVRSVLFGTTGQITLTDSNTTLVDYQGTNFSWTGTSKIVSTYASNVGTRTFNIGNTAAIDSAYAFDVIIGTGTGISLSASATDTVALTGIFNNVDLRGFIGILSNTARSIAGNFYIPSTGGTYTAGTSVTTFIGNTSTYIVDTATRVLDFPFTFNGSATWNIANNFTSGSSTTVSTRTLTLTSGNVSFGSVQINCGLFSSTNSNARNLDFGASGRILLLNSVTSTLWDTTIGTNFTWTGNFDVDCNFTGAITKTINFGTIAEAYAPNVKVATAGTGFGLNTTSATESVALLGNMGNLDLTSFAGTLTNGARNVYGNLTFPVSGGTFTSGTVATTLAATSGTESITYNGRTIDFPLTINGTGGTFVANGPINIGATRTFTLQNGTFNSAFHSITANNITISTGNVAISNVVAASYPIVHTSGNLTLSSNVSTGKYTLDSGSLNLNNFELTCNNFVSVTTTPRAINFETGRLIVSNSSGGTIWNTGTITNLSTSGSDNVTISSGGTAATTINPGSLSEANSINFSFPAAGSYNLTITSGSAVKTLNFRGPVSGGYVGTLLNGDRTVFGDFITSTGMSLQAGAGTTTFANTSSVQNIVSNAKTFDFPITINATGGTVRLRDALTIGPTRTTTLTAGTLDLNDFLLDTTSFSSTNSNLRSIAFANTGRIQLAPSTAVTFWNTGTTTNFSYTGNSNIRTVSTGAVTKTINTGTMNESQAMNWFLNDSAGTIAFTSGNAVKNLVIQGAFTLTNIPMSLYGNYTYVTATALTAGTNAWTFAGNNQTINTGGLTHDFPFTFNNTGLGSILQSAVTLGSSRQTTLANGVLNLNGFSYSTGSFFTNPGTKTLQFDGGTLTVVGSGTAFNNANNTGFSSFAGSNSGTISLTSSSAKTFAGNNAIYAANLNQGGAGQLTVTGNNAFQDLSASITATSNATISFAANTNTNFNVFTLSGNSVSNRFVTLNSDNVSSIEGLSSIVEGGIRIYRSNTVYYRASLSCNATSNVSNGFVTGINYIQCRDIAFLPAPKNGSDFYRWYVGSNSLSLDNNIGAVFQNYDANNLTKVYVIEANTSWTVPNDFNTSNNTIHLFGGGGSGGMGGARFSGGGGGGGGYTRANNIILPRNQTITIEVGQGGSNTSLNGGNTRVFSWYGTYNANGGLGASGATAGQGGRGLTFNGGSGGAGGQNINYVQFAGAGGGGGAGPSGNGASGGAGFASSSSNQGAGAGGGGASGGTAGTAGGSLDSGAGGNNSLGFGRDTSTSSNPSNSFAGGGGTGPGFSGTLRASSGSSGIDLLRTFSGGGGGGGGGPDNSHAAGALNAAAIAGIGGRFGGAGGGGASASTTLFAIGSAGGTGGVIITYKPSTLPSSNGSFFSVF